VRLVALFALVAVALGAFVLVTRGSSSSSAVVARVIDGDTIELVGGQRVRLVQIDTPEKREECYGDAASALTRRLLPAGTKVRIEQDPGLDQVDRYQRKLAYVWKGDEDVNVTLVREGAASVWFYGGKQGRHAKALLQATEQARSERRGLWAACPLARFDPLGAMSSGPAN
jgi:micrococcal nuclease